MSRGTLPSLNQTGEGFLFTFRSWALEPWLVPLHSCLVLPLGVRLGLWLSLALQDGWLPPVKNGLEKNELRRLLFHTWPDKEGAW